MPEIYVIRNKIDNKCYVGQTKHDFHARYNYQRDWWNVTSNQYLKNAVDFHGLGNFEVIIVADDKDLTIEDLNVLEEFWADHLNSYHPNGYNLTRCGGRKTQHETVVSARRRPLGCSNGKNYESVTHAAKDIGVRPTQICNQLSGEKQTVKGLVFWDLGGEAKTVPIPNIRIICSNGEIYYNQAVAQSELDLAEGSISNFLSGRRLHVKGMAFAVYVEGMLPPAAPSTVKNYKRRRIIRSDGTIYGSTQEAAKSNNVDYRKIMEACNKGVILADFYFKYE